MEEKTVQREDVLGEAIQILEIEGIANTTLEMVAERVSYPLDDLKRFWPDRKRCCTTRFAISAIRWMPGAVSCCWTTRSARSKSCWRATPH
jgi:hypothetical protein